MASGIEKPSLGDHEEKTYPSSIKDLEAAPSILDLEAPPSIISVEPSEPADDRLEKLKQEYGVCSSLNSSFPSFLLSPQRHIYWNFHPHHHLNLNTDSNLIVNMAFILRPGRSLQLFRFHQILHWHNFLLWPTHSHHVRQHDRPFPARYRQGPAH